MTAYTFPNVSEALPVLCRVLLEDGYELGSRNGRVKELTNVQITLTKPWEREVLSAHRHASVAAQIAETMWVLAGRNDVEWLSHYLPRAAEFSDDGSTWRAGYGPRLRGWEAYQAKTMHIPGPTGKEWDRAFVRDEPVDQVREVIKILSADPASRRAVINIFDPSVDFEASKDIPCNNWLHFLNRDGRLNLHVAVRSNDLMWGWSGINAFEWSVLQEIVASCLGVMVGTLTFSISSLHLYEHHWVKAEKIGAEGGVGAYRGQPMNLLRGDGLPGATTLTTWDDLIIDFFNAEKVIRDTAGGGDSAIRAVKHPNIRSMLRVLQHYWGGDIGDTLEGGALQHAVAQSPNGGRKVAAARVNTVNTDFIESAIAIHNDKHKAYGDSWKKRGEAVSIQANIARKVDRLGHGDTNDETQADTALDLLVYLAKYDTWLAERGHPAAGYADTALPSDSTEHPNAVLRAWDRKWQGHVVTKVSQVEAHIKKNFEDLLRFKPNDSYRQKRDIVQNLAIDTYCLALYWHEKMGDDYRADLNQ